ncbi:MAG TPA: ABC transporter ATP-binding protein [Candidatus Fimivicinus intestinavium]|nr:ABC transporter ATP-binding protein [Candidatus Fimivicinus intestinavium]
MSKNRPAGQGRESSRRLRAKDYNRSRNRRPPNERPRDLRGTALRLAALLKPFWPSMLLVVLTAMLSTVVTVFGPMLLGDAVDAIQEQVEVKLAGGAMDFGEIGRILLMLAGLFGMSSLLSYVQAYTMAGVTQKVVCSMREQVNSKLSRLPLRYFDGHTKGDILSRIMNDIDNVSNTLQNNLTQILTSTVMLVSVLGMMFYVSWRMTLIAVSVLPACLIVTLLISRRSRRYFRRQWDHMGELNGHIEEMYTGHNIVKVFGHEKNAIEEFDDINDELYLVSRRAQFISGTIMPLLSFINNIGYILICVAGGSYVLSGTISLGDITSFIMYSKMFTQPIADLGNIANNIQSSLASAERVFRLLDEEEEPPEQVRHTIEKAKGDVRFEHVDFQYLPEKPLIRDLNLEAKPGQLVAIVGPTGAGKTTLVNLLMRFYDVNAGRITIDGCDIRELSRENLRHLFGMVLQDTWLFEGSIYENIAYGRPDAIREEVEAAARLARVTHFIHTLPDGYDTRLEEDGLNLSQGQRQLLTIARAILADPAILILDEATSSVDTRTEVLIQKAMQELMHNRTCFVIAHRLSTIRTADVILAMNHGKIVEVGRHEELMERGGFYAELYNSQFAGSVPAKKAGDGAAMESGAAGVSSD